MNKVVKQLKALYWRMVQMYYTTVAKFIFRSKGVLYGSGLTVNGYIKIAKSRKGSIRIGNNVSINSGNRFNIIGRNQRTSFVVNGGDLIIHDCVGLSSTVIVCRKQIVIENGVIIGGGCVIYDTDFHSLNFEDRRHSKSDMENTKQGSVIIGKDTFIGAHCTILKNTVIGSKSIIGACSVIAGKQIGDGEVWAGNPAAKLSKYFER